jgi:hypothetical protein
MLLVMLTGAACRSAGGGRPDASGAGGVGGAGATGGASCGTTADGTMASVTPIVARSCAITGCHDPITHEHGMDLSTADLVHKHWVGKFGIDHCRNIAVPRVVAGDPEGSFVMTKLRGPEPLCSASHRMPPPPAEMLAACEIDAVRRWIAAGAPPAPPSDAGADGDIDADGASDAGADDADPDPSVCSSARPCDPDFEICVEVMPVSTSDNCYTRWECYTHAPPDGTQEHPCPAEIVTFCGCDGTTFEAPYACPNRPYVHVGDCSDGYSCDAYRVRCSDPAPACPDGQAPAVIDGCWGPCVPIDMCRCDLNWQCPQRDTYRCNQLPEFRCGLKP